MNFFKEDDKKLEDFVNPEIDFSFNGKVYRIKRDASIKHKILYKRKLKDLIDENGADDPGINEYLLAYCFYIRLLDADDSITEEYVLDTLSAKVDIYNELERLGFMTPQEVTETKELQEKMKNLLITSESSPLSSNKRDTQ